MEFEPEYFSPANFNQLNRRGWEQLVIKETTLDILRAIATLHHGGSNLPDFKFRRGTEESRLLGEFYDLFKRIPTVHSGKRTEDPENRELQGLLIRNLTYFRNLVDNIRRKNQYRLLLRLDQIQKHANPDLDDLTHDILRGSIVTLHLMLSDPNHFLVGMKDGPQWKKIMFAKDEANPGNVLIHNSNTYLQYLGMTGKRELVAVPEMRMHPDDQAIVDVPKSTIPADDWLEDAYYRQRYIVPPEGAEVRFRNAGDVLRMWLVQSAEQLTARVLTRFGDESVHIDLEEGVAYVPQQKATKEYDFSWAALVAQTYHDLVTAEERSTRGSRKSNSAQNHEVQVREDEEQLGPQVIYIPRVVNNREYPPRLPYDGSPRPVRPHRVSNHFRKGGDITARHLAEVYALEREWGMREGEIVDMIPAGQTWVRPHFSPIGSESVMQRGPIFIKRKILRQMSSNQSVK